MKNENKPFKEVLGSLRRSNLNRIILAHLNINSIPNKFNLLAEGVSGNVDIIMISETKIDETFPARQFYIDGYTPPYRLDRNCNGGGLMMFVREDIPSKLIETRTVKLLGITIDNDLKFDEHLNNVCLKANRKLSALMRKRKYLDFNKTRILFKGFFESHFKYCPLTWISYS